MTEDVFADRLAKVRERFVSTLEAKIDETCAALPDLGGGAMQPGTAATAVAEAYLRIHGIVGIGRTVGFPDTGCAAHEVEDVLRPPYQAARGLTSAEISVLKAALQTLREAAGRELQSLQTLSQ